MQNPNRTLLSVIREIREVVNGKISIEVPAGLVHPLVVRIFSLMRRSEIAIWSLFSGRRRCGISVLWFRSCDPLDPAELDEPVLTG